MSTQLKGVTGQTGEVSMNRYFGGNEKGKCVQLTFKKPEEERGRPDFGYWYLQLTKSQALEMAAALVEFANDTREEVYLAD
jgi:hypothetical protein